MMSWLLITFILIATSTVVQESQRTFNAGPWLEDFEQLKQILSETYPNLEDLSKANKIDLYASSEETQKNIRPGSARLHLHSIEFGKTNHSEYRRPEWDFDAVKVKADSYSKSYSELASHRLQECIKWLSRLEKGDDNYGLIHGDLHRGNFFVVEGQIVSFDYDDSCFHWFLYDLASSLSTVLKLARHESDREQIIAKFFSGYESIRPFSKRWKERFEAFYQYRLSLVFNWMNAMIAEGRFSSATIENWKGVEPWYLETMKRKVAFD